MSDINLIFSTHTRTNTVEAIDYGYATTFFDLTMVLSGVLHYIIDGTDVCLKKGDAIFIPPNSMRTRRACNQYTQYISINYTSNGEIEKEIPLYIPNCSDHFKELLLAVEKNISYSKTGNYLNKVSAGISLLIFSLKDELMFQATTSRKVASILEYIHRNITHPITLKDIAQNVFLSVPYCCTIIKKELNTTIYNIIARERINLAKNYMDSTNAPLSNIIPICGFSDYTQFYKVFKKHTGISPSDYRKRRNR